IYDFLGYRADEIIGRTFFELLDSADKKKVSKKIDEISLSKKPFIDFEKTCIHKDGHKVYVSTSAIPIFDEKGNLQGFQGLEKDISKKVERQQEANAMEERLELALIGSNDGVWDWNIVDNSVYFSPRWKEMLGYSDEELVNEFVTWSDRIHPDDLDETWESIQKHLESTTAYYEGIHRLKHKNGNWVWILDRGKALYNSDGEATRMIGTHTDITEQKEKELKAIHQKQIIEQIHDSVISTDMDGVITGWNTGSEVLLEYSTDEAIGQHISMIYLTQDLEILGKNIATLIEKGEHYTSVSLVTKSKKLLFVDLSLSLLKDEKSIPIGMIGYAKDITKRKQAEDTLEQQARMVQMGEMLSMIAHQWRQPLNAISLTAANLKLKFDFNGYDLKTDKGLTQCSQELSQKLNAIEEYVTSLSTTIDDFRSFYRTDKEYTSKTFEDVVSKSLSIIKVSLLEDRIKLTKEYNSNAEMKMHENEIMQVILNIFKNAQDNFLEKRVKNPSIKIIIDGKKLSICDNAGGIPQNIFDQIFNPYFSTKTDKNGTGLGLYMSKTIIEEHHNAKLTAENLDGGACFSIEFI
ncbi:MAG: PAS domain S-box protein, partial [Campylobacterota bacterium]|nr:PAS domain S-box protein [Campylobacterota bacterium]